MADHPTRPGGGSTHLDAFAGREVVFCHQCEAEWFKEESGLVCPACMGEITEIVTSESDPRPTVQRLETPPETRSLRNHNPWATTDSDPDEADIEEHISHGPGGSTFFSHAIRSSSSPIYTGFHPRSPNLHSPNQDDNPHNGNPDLVLGDFHSMMSSLMGPGFQPGQAGRSVPDSLFTGGQLGNYRRFGGRTSDGANIIGGQFTFTTGGLLPRETPRPRDADEPQPGGLPVDDLTALLSSIFGQMRNAHLHTHHHDRDYDHDHDHIHGPPAGGMPPGLSALFASMINPANSRAGDAVYSQEALDSIISALMEQHPTSNAPGPASPDAIAALPKKKLHEKELGPEGKGECSVCMDDVHLGDEVVCLPCSHWFHETCVGAWLSEHNTCPICRKGIDTDTASSGGRRPSLGNSISQAHPGRHRLSGSGGERLHRSNTTGRRNEARLEAIRNNGRLTPTQEEGGHLAPRRRQIIDERNHREMDLLGSDPHRSTVYHPSTSNNIEPLIPRSEYENIASSSRRRSRLSRRRSSQSSNRVENSSGGSGPLNWLRNRWGGSGDRR